MRPGLTNLLHTVTWTSTVKRTMVKKMAFQWHLYCILSVSCIKILILIYGCSKLTLWSSSFIVYWFRDAPTGWTFNNRTLCPHCIFVFCIYRRTNSDLYHLHHKLICFDNRDVKCLLRVRNGSLNKSSLPFVFKGLITPLTCCGADLP